MPIGLNIGSGRTSKAPNPLSKFSTYQMKHVMGAFKNGVTAESYQLTDELNIGETMTDGVIVINEFKNDVFTIPSIVWEWRKYGIMGTTTTAMVGMMDISDRTGGQFNDWFRTNVLQQLGVSAFHLTFALKTYFIGVDRRNPDQKADVVQGNPLIFQLYDLNDMMNNDATGTHIRLNFTAAYNTTGQVSTICKPYQITLTHKDGNLNNVNPEISNGGCSIEFRGQEDIKYELRAERLNKSKPMVSLKELFDSLDFELNQQALLHKSQVQTWLEYIRNSYVKKIKPPEQERGEKLPIIFEVKLDPKYYEYKVDNRNLPFEQTEEIPRITKGVTSIAFRAGSSIIEMVDKLMRYSIQVGEDVISETPKTYKTNISYVKEVNNIKIVIKIKQIETPLNSVDTDTGPGESALQEPLEFNFKSGTLEDVDITYMKTSIMSDEGFKPIEKPVTEGEKIPLVTFGNREAITAERIPKTAEGSGDQYFKSGFSGLRLPIIPYLNNGLENAEAAALIDIMNMNYSNQPSDHEIQIVGNPDLMFDFHRLPQEAAELDNPGSAVLYKLPESLPLYLKINIFLFKDALLGLDDAAGVPLQHFYQNHYEISGIINDMTDGQFFQHIYLKKTDDMI
jgi:hypothetical protein